jgi:hypothetical protein
MPGTASQIGSTSQTQAVGWLVLGTGAKSLTPGGVVPHRVLSRHTPKRSSPDGFPHRELLQGATRQNRDWLPIRAGAGTQNQTLHVRNRRQHHLQLSGWPKGQMPHPVPPQLMLDAGDLSTHCHVVPLRKPPSHSRPGRPASQVTKYDVTNDSRLLALPPVSSWVICSRQTGGVVTVRSWTQFRGPNGTQRPQDLTPLRTDGNNFANAPD